MNHNNNRGNRIDVLGAKAYFEALYNRTKYTICKKMVLRIEQIELSEIKSTEKLESFIIDKKEWIENVGTLSAYEYSQLNDGIPMDRILEQRDFSNRF